MLNEILFLLTGLVIGIAMGWLWVRSQRKPGFADGTDTAELKVKLSLVEKEKNEMLSEKMKLEGSLEKSREIFKKQEDKLEQLQEANSKATAKLASAQTSLEQMQERIKESKTEVEELQQRFAREFENVANRILDEKTKKFTEQNKTQMQQVIDPFKEQIREFEKKVEETYVKGTRERSTLVEQIRSLTELNQQMRQDARNLTTALKGDNKQQGNWGELILEKILERSGLEKGREYVIQSTTTSEDGRTIKPDVVVHLPDNKHLIVDAKVSLNAYTDWVNETDTVKREPHIKNHLLSLRNHIKLLSEKNYHSGAGINTPEFVLMFVPIESSFSAAVQYDIDLWNYAWDRKVVIVSPSTLLATLRTIASVWKQEKQNQNSVEIARQAGSLYDKFVGFLTEMEKIEKALHTAQDAYQDARSKLHDGKDNLVRKVEKLKELGVKSNKEIPGSFHSPDE